MWDSEPATMAEALVRHDELIAPDTRVQATAFDLTPDSRLLGVGTSDGKLLLLDARTGTQMGAPILAAAIMLRINVSPIPRSSC